MTVKTINNEVYTELDLTQSKRGLLQSSRKNNHNVQGYFSPIGKVRS